MNVILFLILDMRMKVISLSVLNASRAIALNASRPTIMAKDAKKEVHYHKYSVLVKLYIIIVKIRILLLYVRNAILYSKRT